MWNSKETYHKACAECVRVATNMLAYDYGCAKQAVISKASIPVQSGL